MRKSLAIAIGTLFLLTAGTPFAQTAKGPASKPNVMAAQPGSMMTMGAQMGQMDEHMAKMQTLHEKMASAATPEERQSVMEDQRQEMQLGMTMMHDMHQGDLPMAGAGMGKPGQMGKPDDPRAQMQMMEKRIDMMQMMMQSMMDRQGMMAGPKTVAAAPN
jgi:hypothetical protein